MYYFQAYQVFLLSKMENQKKAGAEALMPSTTKHYLVGGLGGCAFFVVCF